VRTGGGQSLSSSTGRRDLDALKLTATSVPDHLQCGICHTIVKSVMLVQWDTAEGRSTCESCIRDGQTKNGFTCPLTGTKGVSPDDLFPNVGLRKAADAFVRDVRRWTRSRSRSRLSRRRRRGSASRRSRKGAGARGGGGQRRRRRQERDRVGKAGGEGGQ
jgi:hypothetical protein